HRPTNKETFTPERNLLTGFTSLPSESTVSVWISVAITIGRGMARCGQRNSEGKLPYGAFLATSGKLDRHKRTRSLRSPVPSFSAAPRLLLQLQMGSTLP